MNHPVALFASPHVNPTVPEDVQSTCGTTRISSSVAPAGIVTVPVCVADVAFSVNRTVFEKIVPLPALPVMTGLVNACPAAVDSSVSVPADPTVGATAKFHGSADERFAGTPVRNDPPD